MAIDFESVHKNFDGMMLDLCVECKGSCEKNEITMFMPGEIDFVAKKLNMGLQEVADKFCNIIKFKGHDIYMLKAGVCPFLNKEYRCELEDPNCKPIRCLLYPTLIGLVDNNVEIFVDYKCCPMAGRISDDFKKKSFEAYQNIKNDIPMWWLEFVSMYDDSVYDYSKLEKLRDKKVIGLDELEKCIAKK